MSSTRLLINWFLIKKACIQKMHVIRVRKVGTLQQAVISTFKVISNGAGNPPGIASSISTILLSIF